MSRPSSFPESLRDHLDEAASSEEVPSSDASEASVSPDERADLERTWALLERVAPSSSDPAVDAAREANWNAIQARLEMNPSADESSSARPAGSDRRAQRGASRGASRAQAPRRAVWASAAIVALALVVAAVWWQQPVTLTAGPGAQQTATLPDGSTVELNGGTTLTYSRGFAALPFVDADRRTVTLEGEAFFDIRKSERPFVVQTQNARVDVLGTRFNVRARLHNATQVTVASGRVRVQPQRRPDVAVVLDQPGASSRVARPDAEPTRPETVSVDRALLWRAEGFAVNGEPLSQVIREIEQRYGMSVELSVSASTAAAPMTLYYPDAPSVDALLQDVAAARGLTLEPTADGFRLIGAKS